MSYIESRYRELNWHRTKKREDSNTVMTKSNRIFIC